MDVEAQAHTSAQRDEISKLRADNALFDTLHPILCLVHTHCCLYPCIHLNAYISCCRCLAARSRSSTLVGSDMLNLRESRLYMILVLFRFPKPIVDLRCQ